MGMLGDFIKAFKEGMSDDEPKKAKQASKGSARTPKAGEHQLKPWPLATPKYEVVISGDDERHIYNYDSRPLKGVRKGQVVTVELFRGEGCMTSTDTGYCHDMNEFNDCMVLYEGAPIGFIKFPVDKLKRAAELGYAIKLKAKCYGMLEGYKGIKDMAALVPEYFYLYDWIKGAEDDRPIWKRENYFKYYEYDKEDYANLTSRYEWEFKDASIRMIPTPPKSTAKPHIGVYAADGMQISEVAAKNGYYGKLIEFMESYNSFDVFATRNVSDMNGEVFFKIEILGK